MRLYTEMYSDIPVWMEKESDRVVELSSSPGTILLKWTVSLEI